MSRTATYGFLSALPLLVLYETMILVANRASGVSVRIGAEVWIKQVLHTIGRSGSIVLGFAVLAIGTAIFFWERKKDIPFRPKYFGFIAAESAVYAFVVAVVLSNVVGAVFANAAVVASPEAAQQAFDLFTNLALSIGAGLYEELLFRVVLVGGAFWLLRLLPIPDYVAYAVAGVGGALVFSWVHYVGPFADAFTLSSFTFRFLFGLALNAIFLVRGFGVAAWTHALYDVYVVTGVFGA